MSPATHRHFTYRWLWPLLVAATVCFASANTVEAPFMPQVLIAPDKVAHFAIFGLLATLIYRALPQRDTGTAGNIDHTAAAPVSAGTAASARRFVVRLCNSANRYSLIAIGITAAFGISDEIHQSFTPGRMSDLYDFAADALGAIVAVCAYRFWPFYRNALELSLLSLCRKKDGASSAAASQAK